MNYWFLYDLSDGSIYETPYFGTATEWTNIPTGCGVIGFTDEQITDNVKEAFEKPLKYKVSNGELLVNSDYVEPTIVNTPTVEEQVQVNRADIDYILLMQGL